MMLLICMVTHICYIWRCYLDYIFNNGTQTQSKQH